MNNIITEGEDLEMKIRRDSDQQTLQSLEQGIEESAANSIDKHNYGRTRFIASSWVMFKRHLKYVGRVELELAKNYKNWIFILLCLITIYLHVIAHNIAYYMAKESEPLRDVFHDLIPQIPPDSYFFKMNSNFLYINFFILGLLGLVAPFIFYFPKRRRYSIQGFISRYMRVAMVTQLMRISTFLTTVIPAPNPLCRGETFQPPQKFSEVFWKSAGGGDRGCGDLVFSSHLMFNIIAIYTVYNFLGIKSYETVDTNFNRITRQVDISSESETEIKKQNEEQYYFISKREVRIRRAILWIAIISVILDIYFILGSRKHYTVDVLVAIYITPLVCYWFHVNVQDPKIPNIEW